MNYLQFVPNDIIKEIVKYLRFSELISFNLVTRSYYKFIKSTRWTDHKCRKFKYFQVGYRFAECSVVGKRNYFYYSELNGYVNGLDNLSHSAYAKINRTFIDNTYIKHISKISTLVLVRCEFASGITIDEFKLLGKVKRLSFRYCKNLPYEWLDGMIIDELFIEADAGPRITNNVLKNFSEVSKLHIYNGNITSDGLKYISNVINLNIISCSKITDSGLKHLVNVKKINLTDCNRITDNGLQYISNVIEFHKVRCPNITPNGIAKLRNVTKLNIWGCKKITESDVIYPDAVTEIDISFVDRIHSNTLNTLLHLNKVDLSYSKFLEDKHLVYLKNAKVVSVNGCHNITDVGLEILTNVEELFILHCAQVSGSCLRSLKKCTKLFISMEYFDLANSTMKHIREIKIGSPAGSRHVTNSELVYLKHLDKLTVQACRKITAHGLVHLANIRSLKLCDNSCITNTDLNVLKHVEKLRIEKFKLVTSY